jgi:carboxymethylenebutenolidase
MRNRRIDEIVLHETELYRELTNQMHEAELKKYGKLHVFHRYAGAGHGFFYWHRPLYRPEQAMDGWGKVLAFFGKHLAK